MEWGHYVYIISLTTSGKKLVNKNHTGGFPGDTVISKSATSDITLTFTDDTELANMIGPVTMVDENGDVKTPVTSTIERVDLYSNPPIIYATGTTYGGGTSNGGTGTNPLFKNMIPASSQWGYSNGNIAGTLNDNDTDRLYWASEYANQSPSSMDLDLSSFGIITSAGIRCESFNTYPVYSVRFVYDDNTLGTKVPLETSTAKRTIEIIPDADKTPVAMRVDYQAEIPGAKRQYVYGWFVNGQQLINDKPFEVGQQLSFNDPNPELKYFKAGDVIQPNNAEWSFLADSGNTAFTVYGDPGNNFANVKKWAANREPATNTQVFNPEKGTWTIKFSNVTVGERIYFDVGYWERAASVSGDIEETLADINAQPDPSGDLGIPAASGRFYITPTKPDAEFNVQTVSDNLYFYGCTKGYKSIENPGIEIKIVSNGYLDEPASNTMVVNKGPWYGSDGSGEEGGFTFATGQPLLATANNVEYHKDDTLGISDVNGTWFDGLYAKGAEVSATGPNPDRIEYTSANGDPLTTQFSGSEADLTTRTWTWQESTSATGPWTNLTTKLDLPGQDGAVPLDDKPVLEPNTYYRVKVRYDSNNADNRESTYNTFKTGDV